MPKNLVREPFSVSLFSGMEKDFASEGDVTIFDFLSNFLCLIVPRKFVGEFFPAIFHQFSVVKKFMHRSGVELQEFPSKIFVSQCRGTS